MLPTGSEIALIAPCGPPDLEATRSGIEILTAWGYRPKPGPVVASWLQNRPPQRPLAFLAASDEQRLAELDWAFSGAFPACWAVRGGHGLNRLTHAFSAAWRPCLTLGFSDLSILLWSLQARGWPALVHAANVQTLPRLEPAALQATRELLAGRPPGPLTGTRLQAGSALGELCGGNLCVLTALAGTPAALQAKDRILFLEDINEAPYRLDRMLQQLWDSGGLRGLRGLALGTFTGCGDTRGLWQHWTQRLGVPVLADLPVGHGADNWPLRLGEPVRLENNQMLWVSTSMASG